MSISRKTFKLSALSLALFASGMSAYATESDSDTSSSKEETEISQGKNTKKQKNAKEFEVIEINGIKGSLSDALLTKRGADSIVDAISAEGIGNFPDSNVAESLQRVPGISITRGFGEGQGVSVRGFSPGMSLTLVNGQSLSSSEFGYETNLGRGFNYGMLPSGIVKRLEVYKAPEAKLPDGGVGGTINVHTRKPLEEANNVFSGSLASGYNDLSGKAEPKATFLGSWKNKDETFGILISGDYQKRHLRRDGVEILSYQKKDFFLNGETLEGALYPRMVGSALFQQERVRETIMATVQWRPSDNLEFTLNSIDSGLVGNNTNSNLISYTHSLRTDNHNQNAVADYDYDPLINTITKIDWHTGNLPSWKKTLGLDSVQREADLSTEGTDLTVDWYSDNWGVSATVGKTSAGGGAGKTTFASFGAQSSLTTGIDDGVGYAQYHDVDLTDPSEMMLIWYQENDRKNTNTQEYVSIDADYQIDGDVFTSLEFGIKVQDMVQERNQVLNRARLSAKSKLTMEQISGENISMTPDDYLDGFNNQTVDEYVRPDNDLIASFVRDPANEVLFTPEVRLDYPFKIEETLTALYTQLNYSTDLGDVGVRGNFGVRAVHSDTVTQNYSSYAQQEQAVLKNYDYRATGSSTDILPSANINFDFDNDVVLRLGLSRVMSRPTYVQLASQLVAVKPETFEALAETAQQNGDTYTQEDYQAYRETFNFQGRAGNADLEPFKADKLDISAEYYYGDASSISLAAFYFDIQSFIIQDTIELDVYNNGDLYEITAPTNGEGGELTGAELALVHHFQSGFGGRFNYTYVNSDSSEEDPTTGAMLPLPGLSKHTVNVVGFYSKGPWNARLSYNYRDDYYGSMWREIPTFTEAAGFWSGKVSYAFNENLTAFISGQNLSDNVKYRYAAVKSRPLQSLQTGRIISAGINFKF